MKKCTSCGVNKLISEYYIHAKMSDGHLNQCKSCVKAVAAARYKEKRKDPEFVESERKRGREKYYRLGSKQKSSNKANRKYLKRFPEILAAHNAVWKKLQPVIGKQAHHWSYKKEHRVCVIYLTPSFHKYIHRFIKYDKLRMCFIEKATSVILDTKKKHLLLIDKLRPGYHVHQQMVNKLRAS